MSKYKAPAYPRVMVSSKRHAELAAAAKAAGKSIQQVAEKRLANKGR